MRDLAAFQRDFAAALLIDADSAPSIRSQAFAIYRNTSARGAVEALRAAFPTVDMLVGEEMFTAVAIDYRRQLPPASPVLSDYGEGLPAYLTRQPWTCELPYLADVARLDWLWLQSFLAPDAKTAPRQAAGDTRIALHPATRFTWLATPAMTIWLAHRGPLAEGGLEPDWIDEGALFTRPGDSVRAQLIDAELHHLLIACSAPTPVADVVAAASEAFPDANVPELLRRAIASGAFIIP